MPEVEQVQILGEVVQQIIDSIPPWDQLSVRERSRAVEFIDGELMALYEQRSVTQDSEAIKAIDAEIAEWQKTFDQ